MVQKKYLIAHIILECDIKLYWKYPPAFGGPAENAYAEFLN